MSTTPINADEQYEDSSEEGSMSFLDHLDELRSRLFRASIAIALSFIVCFIFSDRIYAFLDKPVREALDKIQKVQLENGVGQLKPLDNLPDDAIVDYVFSQDANLDGINIPAGTSIPAKIKTEEKGNRFIVTANKVVLGNRFIDEGFRLRADAIGNYSRSSVTVHTLQGGFNLYIKVAFYGAIALSIPAILWQLWSFIAPGLYEHERKYVWPFVGMATFFFFLGAAFAYYIAFPRAIDFLLSVSQNFQPLIEVNEYFDLIITIILGLGLVFQIPTVVYFLARLGLMTHTFMLRFWRHSIVVIFIIAALLSPTTDIPNMMVFAVPMIMLYLLSIGIAWLVAKPRPSDDQAEAA
ncbi:MAG: twin-arginine translocase subunit TatC [Acidobacteria bacterium]|nr:twin-arginine translocase subunit TatC [Acidobacteriota bacterium]